MGVDPEDRDDEQDHQPDQPAEPEPGHSPRAALTRRGALVGMAAVAGVAAVDVGGFAYVSGWLRPVTRTDPFRLCRSLRKRLRTP